MKPNPKPESKTQKRKKYIQTVSENGSTQALSLSYGRNRMRKNSTGRKWRGSWTVRLYATFPKFNNKRLKPLSLELKQKIT